MKALVFFGPEDLRISQVEDPRPGEGEVLVKLKAVGICGSDVHGYLGITGRRIPPMIMGHEMAGVVMEIGAGVRGINLGERVTVQPIIFCRSCKYCSKGLINLCENKKFIGVMNVNGAMSEYISVPSYLIYKLPENLDIIQGVLVEPLAVAYRAVRRAGDVKGKNVLIAGSGTIGLFVLQMLKWMGAGRIFITDLSDSRLKLAKHMGADKTINPVSENVKEIIYKTTKKEGVDIAFEAVGIADTVKQAMSVINLGGTCIWIGNSSKFIDLNMQETVTRELNVHGSYLYTNKEFAEVINLLSKEVFNVEPVISQTISLEEAPHLFRKLAKESNELVKVIITD